jgi:antitoxin component of RelBE/YafQ-DinJ toxin-antitoxin module
MTTKTIGSRVNSEVHTLFTDVCNDEGITMSQKINQLVTDCVAFPSKIENKVKPEPIEKSTNILDSASKNILKNLIKKMNEKNISHLKESSSNLKTSMDEKLEEDKMEKGMKCIQKDSCFNV